MDSAKRRIGPYSIERELGRGGMGVVHLGHDERLDRRVAIKELPEALADDPDRLARFEREARTLAQLNHPNVTAIHGIEEQDGHRFLVLEYVEGETLEDRLARGPMPVDEALAVAAQIAAGVAAAHDAGVIHRDLKPGNVIVAPDGRASVLDFGLARADEPGAASGATDAHAPTIASPVQNSPTLAGVILGTAAYMSPEQARGRPVDRRTDVWSFGVVLVEMLTARRLFDGDTVSDCIAAVLQRPIDLSLLPEDTPPGVRSILTRCLERDLDARRRDLGDVGVELARIRRGETDATPARGGGASRWPWVAALGALVIGAGIGATLLGGGGAGDARPSTPLVASVNTPAGTELSLRMVSPSVPSISPDGRWLVYGAQDVQRRFRLYLLDLATGRTQVLEGTESGQYPFWSPDSRSIGFFASGRGLLRVERDGGPPRILDPDAPNGKGGAWTPDGRIVYAPDPRSSLSVIDAAGGTRTPVTELDATRGDLSHRHPRLLSGTDAILYLRRDGGNVADGEPGEIRVCRLDGSVDRGLVESHGHGVYNAGHLLFTIDDALVARPFDRDALAFTGEARTVAEGVLVLGGAAFAVFDASPSGALTYVAADTRPQRERLVWYGRDGSRLDTAFESLDLTAFRMIGDGSRITANLVGDRTGEIQRVVLDLEGGGMRRLEESIPSGNMVQVSHDGTRFAHARFDASGDFVLVSPVDAYVEPRVIVSYPRGESSPFPRAWSHDDRFVLVEIRETSEAPKAWWRVPADGSGDPEQLPLMEGTEFLAPSPDGQWYAIEAPFRGEPHVFVAPVDDPQRVVRVTVQPAMHPRWRADGRELFAHRTDGSLIAIDTSASSASAFDPPRVLFDLGMDPTGSWLGVYDVAPDGQRFLVSEPVTRDGFSTFAVMTDWRATLAASQ